MSPRPTISLAEWGRDDLADVTLTQAEMALADRLADPSGPRLRIEIRPAGVRVHAYNWVGLVRFEQFDVQVVPKLAGDHVGLVRLIEWVTGLDALRAFGATRALDLTGSRLPDLLALLFVDATERVVRAGLRSSYLEYEDDVRALRGRLLLERQLRRHVMLPIPLACRFDERSTDIFDNRLLLAGARIAASRSAHEGLRRRARRLRTVLREASDETQIPERRTAVVYDRLNRHYEPAHELSWLLIEAAGVDDLHLTGSTHGFAFLIDMNKLFEAFVERLVAVALDGTGARVRFQHHETSVIRRADGSPYRRLIPDAVAVHGTPPIQVPIDAKYKRYAIDKVDTADIAQVFLYAYALGPDQQPGGPGAVIIFPSGTGNVDTERLVVRHVSGTPNARLLAVGMPIAAVLDELAQTDSPRALVSELRDRLLELMTP